MLSVITVVKNDLYGFVKTYESVVAQRCFLDFEYIVIDGGSVDGTLEYISSNSSSIDYFVSETDRGIYDAMNKGVVASKGRFLLFLNAGDFFVGDVLSKFNDKPCFLPVYRYDFFNKLKKIRRKDYRMGIPNCHQGIIFENKKKMYDLNYRISSDYDYYIRHKYKNNLSFLECNGYVYFDDKGVSTTRYFERDREINLIRKKYFDFHIHFPLFLFGFFKNYFRLFLTVARSKSGWLKFP